MNAPFNLVTTITYRCNIKCKHCFASSPQYCSEELKKDELSTEQWYDIFKKAADIGVHEIYFGGGEPFIRQDFLDLVKGARKEGLGVTMTTNGTLLDDDKARTLVDLGVECIEVSIDGIGATHDEMRGAKGLFNKASKAVETLARNKIYVIASMTITAKNKSEMMDVYDWMAKCGAREVLYMRFVPTGTGKRNRDDLYITGQQYRDAIDGLVRSFSDEKQREILCQSNSDAFFYPHAGCIPGRTYCFIRPNGDVTPCNPLIFPETRCGNLQESTLDDIWSNGKGFDFVRKTDFSSLPSCDTCKKREICSGGCRILCQLYQNNCNGDYDDCGYHTTCNEATGLCGKKYMYYARIS